LIYDILKIEEHIINHIDRNIENMGGEYNLLRGSERGASIEGKLKPRLTRANLQPEIWLRSQPNTKGNFESKRQ